MNRYYDIEELVRLLKASVPLVSDRVYESFVPEGSVLPAIAVNNLGNPSQRQLDGQKKGISSTWRVTVVANGLSSLRDVYTELESLDNTSGDDFSRVFAELILTESKQPDQSVRRGFYDLTLH